MTKEEVIAQLNPAEAAGYSVDALLHLLEIASWEMCSNLSAGSATTVEMVDLAGTIDRTVELARKTHAVELEAICGAALVFVPRGQS